jgi:predicted nucleotidyltransferase/DNA-binding XRE family transcriptional regulator
VRYGPLLRSARTRAGLSQAALARLAHTSQSAIARYETGVAAPSLPTLNRLLVATGGSLLLGDARARVGRLRGSRTALRAAARLRGIDAIRVFGSTARGEATVASDIDLLVELGPGRTLIDLIGFKQDAERILGRRVDVATPALMKRRVRQRALRDARPL